MKFVDKSSKALTSFADIKLKLWKVVHSVLIDILIKLRQQVHNWAVHLVVVGNLQNRI